MNFFYRVNRIRDVESINQSRYGLDVSTTEQLATGWTSIRFKVSKRILNGLLLALLSKQVRISTSK